MLQKPAPVGSQLQSPEMFLKQQMPAASAKPAAAPATARAAPAAAAAAASSSASSSSASQPPIAGRVTAAAAAAGAAAAAQQKTWKLSDFDIGRPLGMPLRRWTAARNTHLRRATKNAPARICIALCATCAHCRSRQVWLRVSGAREEAEICVRTQGTGVHAAASPRRAHTSTDSRVHLCWRAVARACCYISI